MNALKPATVVCLIATSFGAGCLDASSAPASASEPVAEPTGPAEAFADHRTAIRPLYAFNVAGMGFVDMKEGVAEIPIPNGADRTNLTFEWPPTAILGREYACMVREGDRTDMGPLLAKQNGTSPLRIFNLTLSAKIDVVSAMCVAAGSPIDGQVRPDIDLVAQFRAGAS